MGLHREPTTTTDPASPRNTAFSLSSIQQAALQQRWRARRNRVFCSPPSDLPSCCPRRAGPPPRTHPNPLPSSGGAAALPAATEALAAGGSCASPVTPPARGQDATDPAARTTRCRGRERDAALTGECDFKACNVNRMFRTEILGLMFGPIVTTLVSRVGNGRARWSRTIASSNKILHGH
jgi:hypothetical protein